MTTTEAQQIARIAHAAADWNPFRANCLARSLVLCRLLRSRGLAADLRVGVSKPDGALRGARVGGARGRGRLPKRSPCRSDYASFDGHVFKRGT